ncbi:MAG: exodeoxyribonuclease VII small subunit [Polyangiaceae bacterium]|nr:exodeoxyribonuclease VII small subunit [Polyangiaceae bacterium]
MSSRAPEEQPNPDDAAAAATGSFEESVRRLAAIVEQLEAGDQPLERSLELFEEGVKLARAAQERLDRAERRVEELLGVDAQGRPVLRALSGT